MLPMFAYVFNMCSNYTIKAPHFVKLIIYLFFYKKNTLTQ